MGRGLSLAACGKAAQGGQKGGNTKSEELLWFKGREVSDLGGAIQTVGGPERSRAAIYVF